MNRQSSKIHSFSHNDRTINIHGIEGEYIFDFIGRTKGFYEVALLDVLAEFSTSSDGIAVDVGANIGNHSVYFATTLNRKVLAIEPDPVNVEILRDNIRGNGLDESVRVLSAAAWDSVTTVALRLNVEGNRGAISAAEAATGIPTVILDDVLTNDRVAVLKIDVEGAELNVLRGIEKVLKRDKPIVSIEAHTSEMRAATAQFMEKLGFNTLRIAGESDNYVWIHHENKPSGGDSRWMRSTAEGLRSNERWSKEIGTTVAATHRDLIKFSRTIEDQVSRIESSVSSFDLSVGGDSASLRDLSEFLRLHSLLLGRVDLLQSMLSDQGAKLTAISSNSVGLFEVASTLESIRRSVAMISDNSSVLLDDLDSISSSLRTEVRSTGQSIERGIESVQSVLGSRLDYLESAAEAQSEELKVLKSAVLDRLNELESYIDPRKADSVNLGRSNKNENPEGCDHYPQLDSVDKNRDPSCGVDMAESPTTDGIAKIQLRLDELTALVRDGGKPIEGIGNGERSRSATNDSLQKLLRAYSMMAIRLERLAPEKWNAKNLVEAAHRGVGVELPDSEQFQCPTPNTQDPSGPPGLFGSAVEISHAREFDFGPPNQPSVTAGGLRRDSVRIGIASMNGRESGLARVLEIVSPQADEVFVYLNGMTTVPESLPQRHNVRFFTGPDLGDRGKFSFILGYRGYYLTCDDDIEYAPFHVQSIIDGIERYRRSAVVGWHGSLFKQPFENFYDSKSRQVLSFRTLRGQDTPAHLLGTGVCGFHTDTIQVSPTDFKLPNMADAFLAILAKKQNVPMIVLAHGKDWATPIDVGPSISTVSLGRDKSEVEQLDVAKSVTEMIASEGPWTVVKPVEPYVRRLLSVAFIGRTDKERWRKGGILKSAHLTVDSLRRFGVEVSLEDIETGDPTGLSGRSADVVMIYAGDPERPDFKKVEDLIDVHADLGRIVLVNLSYNGVPRRTKFISEKMAACAARHGRRVRLMVFTEAMFADPGLAKVKDLLVLVPKTLVYADEPVAGFAHSRGVFIGDIAKLSDDSLLDHPAEEWLASIREALPGEPIYAVQQYKPRYQKKLDIDEVWPFLSKEEFSRKVGSCRVMVSTVKYATFEMVPVETAALGVPVIYPEMPQSLSEYLGMAGLCVRSPRELSLMLSALYHDPIVWRSQSEAGISRALSSSLDNTSGQLYLRLLTLASEKDQML